VLRIDIEKICDARVALEKTIANNLKGELLAIYNSLQSDEDYEPNAKQSSDRALKNRCLYYLSFIDDDAIQAMVKNQYYTATNMTDTMAAFNAMVLKQSLHRKEVLAHFYNTWKDDALVLDKWFTAQATADVDNIHDELAELLAHEKFVWTNPNRVRSLIGAFCMSNLKHFHHEQGKGYQFLGDAINKLNKINPQIAARLLGALNQWRKFDDNRQQLMVTQLKSVLSLDAVSKDVYEIASKAVEYKAN
jgi:aminopeptidase N